MTALVLNADPDLVSTQVVGAVMTWRPDPVAVTIFIPATTHPAHIKAIETLLAGYAPEFVRYLDPDGTWKVYVHEHGTWIELDPIE